MYLFLNKARYHRRVLIVICTFVIYGCNDAPIISGTPQVQVEKYGLYSFLPTVDNVSDTAKLSFNIKNKPDWASFNSETGALKGVPNTNNVGIDADIVIRVTDISVSNIVSSTSLPPFDIEVQTNAAESFNEALFASPVASSVTGASRQFEANDDISTSSKNGWVTNNPIEQSITLNFDTEKAISRVELADLLKLRDQILEATVRFSDGSSFQTGPLTNDGTPLEFTFWPKKVSWIQVTIDAFNESSQYAGLSEFKAFSLLDKQTISAAEQFNDGDANGWAVVEDAGVRGNASWAVNGNEYTQSGYIRGYSLSGIELGTYSLMDSTSHNAMDLRLQMSSNTSSSGDRDTADVGYGVMGVLFAYQDDDNYYRFDMSHVEGHSKLLKRVDGEFIELASSTQRYEADEVNNVQILMQDGVIILSVGGQQVLATQDNTFQSGRVALFCARNVACTFDKLFLLTEAMQSVVALSTPSEYSVAIEGEVDVAAVVTNPENMMGVEFVSDLGLASESTQVSLSAPFEAQFGYSEPGDHTISVFLLDEQETRLQYIDASDVTEKIGVKGLHVVGLGDSITQGFGDDISSDDVSLDLRTTSGGYPSILSDLMSDEAIGVPVAVINEGNQGENTIDALARIQATLTRTSKTQAYLMMYGANDTRSSLTVPSGLGLSPGDAGYTGSYKDNMRALIAAMADKGKKVFVAKPMPNIANATRTALLAKYGLVIDEIMLDVENTYPDLVYSGPDFFALFDVNRDWYQADGIHPTGVGYQAMGQAWFDVLVKKPL